jgi:hypothetical protein
MDGEYQDASKRNKKSQYYPLFLDAAAEIPKSRKLECFFICLFGL